MNRDGLRQILPLSMRQNAAIAALVTGATVTAAAKNAGVSRQTLHRWLGRDVFRNELRRAASEQRIVLARATQENAVAMLDGLASAAECLSLREKLRVADAIIDAATRLAIA